MRYIFLGKIKECPRGEMVGRFALHTASCNELGVIDLEMQTIEDVHYGFADLQSLKNTLSNYRDTSLIVNGIPEDLFRRFVPDNEYVMGRLSPTEVSSLLSKEPLESRVY